MVNTRTDTKQFSILKIGRIVRRANPNADISSEEIRLLRKKTRKQLNDFIKELEEL